MADDDLNFGPVPKGKTTKPDAADLNFGPVPGTAKTDTPPTDTSATPMPAPKDDRKLLENAPDDSFWTGTAKNTGTTIGKGLAHVPGLAGDLVDMGLRVSASVAAKTPWEDRSREQIEQQWRKSLTDNTTKRRIELETQLAQPGLSDTEKNTIKRHIARIGANPEGTPPTGEQIYQKTVAPTFGDYEPQSREGRFGRAIGEAVIPTVLTPGMGIAKGAVSGAASGAAGQTASELGVEDPLALFGAGVVGGAAPSVLGAGTAALRDTKTGKSKTGQGEAADKIVKNYQEHPETKMESALHETAPEGKPGDIVSTFDKQRDALLKQQDDTALNAPSTSDSGAALQDTLRGKNAEAKQALDKLEASIDPERKMSVWTKDLADHATANLEESKTRPELDRSELADKYLARASKFGDVKNFRDLIDFDRSLTAAQAKARSTGDNIGLAHLTDLKSQVKRAYAEAIDNQHKWEQGEVSKGHMTEEDTLAYRQRQHEAEAATGTTDRSAATGAGNTQDSAGAGAADTQRTQNVRGDVDAGQPGANSIPGEPELAPNLSEDAAGRLAKFNQGHGVRKDTFENSPAGGVADASFGADAAKKAFASGDKGEEVANAVLKAGGDQGAGNMRDIATGNLQSTLKGKPLDQASLDKWRTQYAGALRALDTHEQAAGRPKFSDQFNDAASAGQAVREFEKSSAAKFLGKEPGDIVNHVGRMMQSGDSTTLRQVMAQAKASPNGDAAVAGLQRAAAQSLENDFNTKGPTEILKALRERRHTLDAVFDPANVEAMAKVADEIEQTASAKTIIARATGQPVSGRADMLQAQLTAAIGKDIHDGLHIGPLFWLEGARHIHAGEIHAALVTMGLNFALPMIQKFLAARRIKAGANIANLVAEGLTNPEVGKAMRARAIDAEGRPNMLAFDALAKALTGMEVSAQGEQDPGRQPHAAGGSVFNHNAAAKHMIGMVDKARKTEATHTKPLLQASDTVIANALAMANRRG